MVERLVRLVCGLLVFGLPLGARGQGVPEGAVAGTVVEVGDGEILVDLGKNQGVEEGDSAILYRSVSITHPITKKRLEDRIYLGMEKIARAGSVLSLVVLETVPHHKVAPGDAVVVVRRGRTVAVDAIRPPVECEPCGSNPEALAVHQTWLGTVGRPIEDRIATWEAFLGAHPASPYASNVTGEVAWLKGLVAGEGRESVPAVRERTVVHNPPKSVRAGNAVPMAMAVSGGIPLDRVSLLYRPEGSTLFREVAMRRAGDTAYVGTIPASDSSPGALQYFIEAQDAKEVRVTLFQGPDRPWSVAVVGEAPGEREVLRSRVRADAEYVDFYASNWNTDAFWKTEVDFTYRTMWKPIRFHAFRMGFGIFEGRGGPSRCVERPDQCPDEAGNRFQAYRRVISYAYFEPEFDIMPWLHVLPRLVLGGIGDYEKGDDTTNRRGDAVVGFHGYVRIGHDTGTNLVVGGSVTQEIGVEGLIEMNLGLFPRVPIGLLVAATNLPVGEDYGARLMATVGWRGLDWMSVVFRFGVNMRNIRHAGIGGGAGLEFHW